MKPFTENLRRRVDEIGISLAEAARRCELSERRFSNYAAGLREPDLTTLVRIAKVLDTSTDELLGLKTLKSPRDLHAQLQQQLTADALTLDADGLQLVISIVRAILDHHRPQRTGSKVGRKPR